MTELRYTRKDNVIRVSLHGHAGYNPGNDVVCAGISTITYQMLNTLVEMEKEGKISHLIADVDDGHTIVSFQTNTSEWDVVWRVIETGYKNIQEEYPNYLTIDK